MAKAGKGKSTASGKKRGRPFMTEAQKLAARKKRENEARFAASGKPMSRDVGVGGAMIKRKPGPKPKSTSAAASPDLRDQVMMKVLELIERQGDNQMVAMLEDQNKNLERQNKALEHQNEQLRSVTEKLCNNVIDWRTRLSHVENVISHLVPRDKLSATLASMPVDEQIRELHNSPSGVLQQAPRVKTLTEMVSENDKAKPMGSVTTASFNQPKPSHPALAAQFAARAKEDQAIAMARAKENQARAKEDQAKDQARALMADRAVEQAQKAEQQKAAAASDGQEKVS